MNKTGRLKKIFFLIFAVAVNVAGGKLVEAFYVPLYMDSVLTIAVAAGCGPVFAVACAVLSQVVMFLLKATAMPFVICHILTALLAWLAFRHYEKAFPREPISAETFMWAGLWSALSNAAVGNIIVSALFSFRSDWTNTSPAVQGLYIATKNIVLASYFQGILMNLADKLLSASVCCATYRVVFEKSRRGGGYS